MVKRFLAFACGFLVLVVLTDKVLMPLYIARSSEIEVPNVTNQDVTHATMLLEKAGLTMERRWRYEPSMQKDIVLHQSPEHGYLVKPGRIVHVVVSQNELMVTVPGVRLTTLRDAQFTLESVGLRLGELDSMPTRQYPEGIVVEQYPEGNTRVSAGTAVNLVVSQVDDTSRVRVPYVIGKSLAEAKSFLADARLRIGKVDRSYDAALLPGTVLRQSMDTLELVAQRTSVDLVVSSTNTEDRP